MNRLILKIYAWQNTAAPWFWLFVISAGYLAVSYFFFQRCLFMSPTQTSALVRLGFAVAGVGALIGLLLPFGFITRLVAYALGFAGAIYGYLQSSASHPAADTANCLAAPAFPFAAPLDSLLPELFRPASCTGTPSFPAGTALSEVQSFFGGFYGEGFYLVPSIKFADAAQCAQVAFAAFAAILAVMFAGFLYGRFTRSF
ncbi:disulfide bond formation protein B [uncultured Campylobacter sp.]|uniref:disulfide bond formation protein B n=1 Tax=uncultured Campylobacter sp. TaxID=218934 RepID=UPI002610B489|nr:disulfide bond formation protein B [uncultured Campylobacter sp.]